MNTIIKILLYLVKILNTWVFVIPINFNILSTAFCFGTMYLLFGTISMHDLECNWFGQVAVFILLGVPALMGVFSFLTPEFDEAGNGLNNSLNSAIAHRNMMMNHADPKTAYNIMKKTSHLDMMANNSNSSAFNNAKKGFNAESGIDSPSRVYENLMK
jgi:hypothetical protein